MKKQDFMVGVLCGAMLFGGGSAVAAGVTAVLSDQPIYVNGEKAEMTAYNIAGNNYVRLRDIGRALDIGVTFDAETNSVSVNSGERYTEEMQQPQMQPFSSTEPKVLTGQAYAREDFSQAANPAIFTGNYTRAAYNAARQSILDRDSIVAGNNADGYNPNYQYADCYDNWDTHYAVDKALGRIYGYYFYDTGNEPHTKGLYQYPGYFIVKITPLTKLEAANKATEAFISEIAGLDDRDKVIRMNDYVCEHLTYGDGYEGISEIFTSEFPVKGTCASYCMAFTYLCERTGIPNVAMQDDEHGWNTVYVDGKWSYVDVTANDTGDTDYRDVILLSDTMHRTDINPQAVQFAKELLVPGSTK